MSEEGYFREWVWAKDVVGWTEPINGYHYPIVAPGKMQMHRVACLPNYALVVRRHGHDVWMVYDIKNDKGRNSHELRMPRAVERLLKLHQ